MRWGIFGVSKSHKFGHSLEKKSELKVEKYSRSEIGSKYLSRDAMTHETYSPVRWFSFLIYFSRGKGRGWALAPPGPITDLCHMYLLFATLTKTKHGKYGQGFKSIIYCLYNVFKIYYYIKLNRSPGSYMCVIPAHLKKRIPGSPLAYHNTRLNFGPNQYAHLENLS